MTALAILGRFVAEAPQLPERLHPTVATAVADVFGSILAGAQSEVARRIWSGVAQIAAGDAPLYGTGKSATPGYAALINAAAGHAYDLDDWEEPGNTHPSVVMVPALLAAAEARSATGGEFLAAYAVGFEVIARLGEALTLEHYARGFHSTATLGAIGAAAAVSRLIALSGVEATHAMSLATSQAVGYTCQFGSNAKPLQAGYAAQTGLVSALLAEAGVTGQPHVLDHARGMTGLMSTGSRETFERALAKLYAPLALEEYGILLKPWPCCSYTHRLLTCALSLRDQLADQVVEIAGIEARLPDFHHAILPFSRPTTRTEALFSVEASLAQGLATGRLTLADSEARFWEKPEVAKLIRKTTVIAEPARNPNLNYDPDQPDRLRITLKNGETLAAKCAYPLGAPQNPMSAEQLAEKFSGVSGRDRNAFERLMAWPDARDIALFFREMER